MIALVRSLFVRRGRWEVVEVDGQVALRWSIPDSQGRYAWKHCHTEPHWPAAARMMAASEARRLNMLGLRPSVG